ncbi:MAG: peptide deformylase [Candidatus Omnitrophica bacterium]|nr:peptide deformylase [Candidatus Omnitrophota bacterium]
MKVNIYPAPCLRQKCKPVEKITAHIQQTLKEMAKTMYAAGGIGLAAPQVGIDRQLVVLDIGEGLKCLVNPKVISRQGTSVLEEGCLSLPGITVKVRRARKVKVQALNEKGEPVSLDGQDLLAHVLQHEIDHLHGRLIIDYAGLRDKWRLRRKLKELKRQPAEEIKCSVEAKCI